MIRIHQLALAVLAGGSLSAADTLHVGVYDGYATPEMITAFQQLAKERLSRDIEVQPSIYESNKTMFDMLRAGKQHIIMPSHNAYRSESFNLIGNRLVRPLDLTRLRHHADLIPDLRDHAALTESGKTYGAPMTYVTYSLSYNPALVTPAPSSWRDLPTTTHPYAINGDWYEFNLVTAALIHQVPRDRIGQLASYQTPEIAATLRTMAQRAKTFWWGGADDADTIGQVALAASIGYAIPELAKRGQNWVTVDTPEGVCGTVDATAITSTCPENLLDVAYLWVDFTLSPAYQAMLFKATGLYPTNPKTGALLSAEERTAAHLDQPDWVSKKLVLIPSLSRRDENGMSQLWQQAMGERARR